MAVWRLKSAKHTPSNIAIHNRKRLDIMLNQCLLERNRVKNHCQQLTHVARCQFVHKGTVRLASPWEIHPSQLFMYLKL